MFSSSELFNTNLSSAQLAIGLLFGFIPVALTILGRRLRAHLQSLREESARVIRASRSTAEAADGADNGRSVVVDMSTMLRAAYYTLGVLSARREPILFWTLVYEVQAVQKIHQDFALLSSWKISAALERLLSQGFVRMERDRVAITEPGRVLYLRIGRLAGASILEGVRRSRPAVAVRRPDRSRGERGKTRTRALASRHDRRPRLRSRR